MNIDNGNIKKKMYHEGKINESSHKATQMKPGDTNAYKHDTTDTQDSNLRYTDKLLKLANGEEGSLGSSQTGSKGRFLVENQVSKAKNQNSDGDVLLEDIGPTKLTGDNERTVGVSTDMQPSRDATVESQSRGQTASRAIRNLMASSSTDSRSLENSSSENLEIKNTAKEDGTLVPTGICPKRKRGPLE